jgi:preprotein translocase subunit SecD
VKSVAALTAVIITTIFLLACGDGNPAPSPSPEAASGFPEGPSVRVALEFDTRSPPPPLTIESDVHFIETIMKNRILNLGGFNVRTLQENSNRLSIEFQGIALDQATDLLGSRALLEFRQPVLDDSGRVLCSSSDGSQFSAEPGQITETPADGGGMRAECVGVDGANGEVTWEPATGTSNGQSAKLDIYSVSGASYDEIDRYGPLVVVDFSAEGDLIFGQVTERLVGYPLAIFVDNQLLVAPTVSEPIAGGSALIANLNVDEARILAAQLNAGPMPVPVRVISAEDVPE